jgi:hypothetical protein
MSVEDSFEFPFKDLKQLVNTLSSSKKADIKAGFWGGVRMHPKESDLNYLKQIATRMDDSRSVRRGVPIVTEEGLRYYISSDWCQQSLDRKFIEIPEEKPFLLPQPIYDYLRFSEKVTRRSRPSSGSKQQTYLTKAEIDKIIEFKHINSQKLEPRTMSGGVAFIKPRIKEQMKRDLFKVEQKEIPSFMRPVSRTSRSTDNSKKNLSLGDGYARYRRQRVLTNMSMVSRGSLSTNQEASRSMLG